jgi:hypothetical protein
MASTTPKTATIAALSLFGFEGSAFISSILETEPIECSTYPHRDVSLKYMRGGDGMGKGEDVPIELEV